MNNKFVLRKFTKKDVLGLYNALRDKRVINHMASKGITHEDCNTIITASISHWKKYQIGSYGVIDSKSDKIIGWAGFKSLNGDFELLLVLSPKYWGSGKVIYEDLINKAKNEFFLNEVYILLPITRKSHKYIKKLGFKYCGEEIYKEVLFKKFIKKL